MLINKLFGDNFSKITSNYDAVIQDLKEKIYHMNFQIKEKVKKNHNFHKLSLKRMRR